MFAFITHKVPAHVHFRCNDVRSSVQGAHLQRLEDPSIHGLFQTGSCGWHTSVKYGVRRRLRNKGRGAKALYTALPVRGAMSTASVYATTHEHYNSILTSTGLLLPRSALKLLQALSW